MDNFRGLLKWLKRAVLNTAEPKVPSVRIGHPLPFDSWKVGRVRLIASDSKSDGPSKAPEVRILHLPPNWSFVYWFDYAWL